MKHISKAVFPVAGLGTRFLPVTKASPKEMLPIVDKPLIQYAVEEAVQAGITELIFVTGRSKRAIEDHFDTAFELEYTLERKAKYDLLDLVRNILPKGANCIYIRQPEPLGLGHAIACARHIIVDEPFAVLLADDLLESTTPVLKQMIDVFAKQQHSLLCVEEVPLAQTSSYGIVAAELMANRLSQIRAIIEKPMPEKAPSNIAVIGRYVFTPRIFDFLEKLAPGSSGEIQLTDAIALLLKEEPVLGYSYHGKRFDCGSKLGYLRAMVEFGISHPELGEEFRAYLNAFVTHS